MTYQTDIEKLQSIGFRQIEDYPFPVWSNDQIFATHDDRMRDVKTPDYQFSHPWSLKIKTESASVRLAYGASMVELGESSTIDELLEIAEMILSASPQFPMEWDGANYLNENEMEFQGTIYHWDDSVDPPGIIYASGGPKSEYRRIGAWRSEGKLMGQTFGPYYETAGYYIHSKNNAVERAILLAAGLEVKPR